MKRNMSSLPRPWVTEAVPFLHLLAADGSSVIEALVDKPEHVAPLILRRVNAFDALLAVAKAVRQGVMDERDDVPAAVDAAMQALYAQHPGWQEWAP